MHMKELDENARKTFKIVCVIYICVYILRKKAEVPKSFCSSAWFAIYEISFQSIT